MVLSVFTAFVAGICSEVKHIPYVGCPQIFSGVKLFDQFFMVICLIFFCVIPLIRIGSMPVQCFAAVLAAADRNVRMSFVEVIKPRPVHRSISAVPSEIVVVGYYVRDLDVRIVYAAGGKTCDGSQACLVHFVNQIVQDPVIFQKILIGLAAHGDFIGKSPHNNGGMIVVLHDQFLHLGNGVLASFRHVGGDVRNLCPYDHSPLVTEIVEILVMLVVSQTDGGRSEFADQIHILFVMLRKQGVSDSPSVLMAGYAAQWIFLAI